MAAVSELYRRIVNPTLLVRRINIVVNHLIDKDDPSAVARSGEQISIFDNTEELEQRRASEESELERERRMQSAVIGIKKKYGKNAILRGMNLEEGATAKDRNSQIGGHKA